MIFPDKKLDGSNYGVVEGKNCGSCGMCCYLLGISEFNKPKFQWCVHCSTKKSCDDYENRPDECREFLCHYLTDTTLDDKWKPNKSKIILVMNQERDRLTVFVDPKRPDAWTKEPYLSKLKTWSASAVEHRSQVIVDVGGNMFIVFPDRYKALGKIEHSKKIVTTAETTASGIKLDAYLSDRF